MIVTVRFFAMLKDMTDKDVEQLDVSEGACGRDVQRLLEQQYHQLDRYLNHCRLAVNWEYQPWETPLHAGDELGLIPPVSGG